MKVSEKRLKWALRIYPPLLLQRIWTVGFQKDFRGVKVKIFKSLLNRNYNRSIFGGTVFAAADPFYPLLFHQVLTKKGYKVRVWVKSAKIDYILPGHEDLFFSINITNQDIEEVENTLNKDEKHIKLYPIEMVTSSGELCVLVMAEIYIRNLRQTEINNQIAEDENNNE
jgi:hypothetical protein